MTSQFMYQKTTTGGKPQPRYIFNSYRNKKKLDVYSNPKIYSLIDTMYPRQYTSHPNKWG